MRLVPFSLASALVLSSLGCALGTANQLNPVTPTETQTITLQGHMLGGQQPISGATIKLYHVNVSTERGNAASMLSGTTTTASDGSFNITGKYTCSTTTPYDVYLIASGGQPITGTSNTSITEMAALGLCTSLSSSTFVNLNEISTVAAIAALSPYMASPTYIGSSSGDAETANLVDRFTLANQFVGLASGVAPGDNVPSGKTVPASLLNTLGNIMAACVNSATGSDNCNQLFSLATASDGTVPTDTSTAMLNILNHPTLNTSALFNLSAASSPFQPALSAAPTNFSVAMQPTTAQTVTRSLYTFPDDGWSSLYTYINNATTSIDMTMYELIDTSAQAALVSACQRGVKVRVILDETISGNTTALNQLNAQTNCSAVKSNASFSYTHEKSMVIDDKTLVIMTGNLTSQYYSNGRDFALVTDDAVDVAAVLDTFNLDYSVGNTSNDTAEDYDSQQGNDLIWSPSSAQPSLVQIINNATTSVQVEAEEMSASSIVTALANAATRGVNCQIVMTQSSSWTSYLTTLKAAGCNVRLYADQTGVLYIHAKIILADYGTSGQQVYLGSINATTNSMLNNRELGTVLTDPAIITKLNTVLTSDYNGGTAF
ncbi:MAG: phospholipase D-like domain-containing protein [Acidobacteriaceae bacterium]|nr:phospholipase D-like domain-containing protein [Acidobacteriaceae bacterium]